MFRTTLKGIAAHKVRLLTTTFAVMLGVAFMAGTLVLTDTVGKTFDDLMADTTAGTDAVVRSSSVVESELGDQRGTVDDRLVGEVAAVDGVAAAVGEVSGSAQIVGSDGTVLGGATAPPLGGSWSTDPRLNAFTLVEGTAPDAAGEVVVDRGSFEDGGFVVGDQIRVLTAAGAKDMTLTGVVSFGDSDSPAGATVALFDLATAQSLLGEPGRLSEISVVAADGVSQVEVTDNITRSLATSGGSGGIEAITGEASTEEQQSDVQQSLSFFNTFLLVFAGIALFVGSFIIANTFSILVAQRTREHALLRAIGASRRQVLLSILVEAVIVGVVASAVGLVAGIGVASGLQVLLGAIGLDIPASGTVVATSTVVLSFGVGVGITLVSALLPAVRASKVPPIAALRDVALDNSSTSIPRIAGGVVLAALGALSLGAGLFGASSGAGGNRPASVGAGAVAILLAVALLGPAIATPVSRLLGFPVARLRGVSGNLARANAARNPRRTSATAAALMIGVSLVGTITIVAASTKASVDDIIGASFAGDLVVSGGTMASTGFSPDLASGLDALAETADVVAVRAGAVEVDGSGTIAAAIDTSRAGSVVDLGVVDGSADDMGPGTIAVAESDAEASGVSVGDTISVTFPDTGAQDLEVVATYANDEIVGWYLMDLTTWEANVGTQLDSQVYLTLADGVDIDDGRAAVESVADAYPSTSVLDIDEFSSAQTATIDQILTLIYALLALAVIIALLGIANTLALSVLERTRELGLLRAVGMSRGQLRSTIRWESVLVALLGTVLGLVIGVGFGSALVTALSSEGLTAFVIPVPHLLVITVVAAGAGMLAAARPASRAAKLDILSAIAEG